MYVVTYGRRHRATLTYSKMLNFSLVHFKARLQNCEMRLLAPSCLSVRLSVYPCTQTRFLLDGLS